MRVVVRLARGGSATGSVALTDALDNAIGKALPGFELLATGAAPNLAYWAVRPAAIAADAPYADLGASDPAALRAVLKSAEDRSIDTAGLVGLGQLLFDAVLGAAGWNAVVTALPAGDDHVELALKLAPELDALHNLPWELLHDGARFLALGCQPCVSIVRLVTGPADATPPETLTRVPRVLFAVGASLTDPDVRPGAEFMGVLRRLEREGGAIQPRVVVEASRSAIADENAAFRPDIVHLIGHGRLDALTRQGQLELRPDPGEGDKGVWVSGADLAASLGEPAIPQAVVLSACDTSRVGTPGSPSIASTLVAKGVPIVAAMAGEVADKACRLFTRAVAAAVVSGEPVSVAVATGRRAALTDGTGVASIDWALPVLYLADSVPEGYVLANPAQPLVVRKRISDLDLIRRPVFCGRQEFIASFDELIDPAKPLSVLGAILTGRPEGVGSTRLLRELGARAIRAGHVPVLVGPFDLNDEQRPTDRALLGRAIARAIVVVRKKFDLPVAPSATRAALDADSTLDRDELVDHLRADLFALAADAAALPMTDATPVPILLLAGVHRWDKALPEVLAALDTSGFGVGDRKLPVVFTGAIAGDVGTELRTAFEQYKGDSDWKRYLPLDRWRPPEDELAYQWLLLNPTAFGSETAPPVYTVRRPVNPAWVESCRDYMQDKEIFDPRLYSWAKTTGTPAQWLDPNNDEEALKQYPELSA